MAFKPASEQYVYTKAYKISDYMLNSNFFLWEGGMWLEYRCYCPHMLRDSVSLVEEVSMKSMDGPIVTEIGRGGDQQSAKQFKMTMKWIKLNNTF